MISLSNPPDFTPSAAVGRTRRSSPSGFGSFALPSMPSSSYMLPIRSTGYTGRSFTSSPRASDAPTTWPPLNPPPATSTENNLPQCPRPPFHGGTHWTFGVLHHLP